jgi:hypothetical protein
MDYFDLLEREMRNAIGFAIGLGLGGFLFYISL